MLEGFLSELLRTNVRILSLLESASNQESKDSKFNRVDLLADTDKGKVMIEVQVERESDYLSRILFGTSKVMTEYMKKGEDYHTKRRAYDRYVMDLSNVKSHFEGENNTPQKTLQPLFSIKHTVNKRILQHKAISKLFDAYPLI